MVMNNKKWTLRQKDGLRLALRSGNIARLKANRHADNSDFEFDMVNQSKFSDIDTSWINFEKYRIKASLKLGQHPFIEVINGLDLERGKPPHTYSKWNLCLYHGSEGIWSDQGDFTKDILPLIYTWIYFYEVWLKTNVWYGREWKH